MHHAHTPHLLSVVCLLSLVCLVLCLLRRLSVLSCFCLSSVCPSVCVFLPSVAVCLRLSVCPVCVCGGLCLRRLNQGNLWWRLVSILTRKSFAVLSCLCLSSVCPSLSLHQCPWQYLCLCLCPHPLSTVLFCSPNPHHTPEPTSCDPAAKHMRLSNAIVDAQLTHPVSRDDDAEMPAAPLAHDIATPRRRIGGRCRKWAVSSSQQTSAGAPPAVACSLHTEKNDFNSGAIVTLTMPAYVLSVSTEVSLMIMSCTQNDPGIRTLLRPSDANVIASPRPLQTQRSFSPSRGALIKPPLLLLLMTIRVCLVEKRLYDWTRKLWTSSGLTRSRGTASRTSAAPRTFSHHHQAQHVILRVITNHGPSTLASEPAWKVLVLSSWLLLGRPAVNASESNCAHFLEARLDPFWTEEWPAFWAMVCAECDVALVFSSSRKSAVEQTQSRVHKVATLARSGERGRARRCQERSTCTSHTAGCPRDQESLPSRPRSCSSCPDLRVKSLSGGSC